VSAWFMNTYLRATLTTANFLPNSTKCVSNIMYWPSIADEILSFIFRTTNCLRHKHGRVNFLFLQRLFYCFAMELPYLSRAVNYYYYYYFYYSKIVLWEIRQVKTFFPTYSFIYLLIYLLIYSHTYLLIIYLLTYVLTYLFTSLYI
jgi:hypothetical protein